MDFTLAPRVGTAALVAEFAATGSVSIADLVAREEAEALERELIASPNWVEIFRAGDKVYEMAEDAYRALSETKKSDLRRLIEDSARTGLQYRYRSIRVADEPAARAARGDLLDRFAGFLNTPPVLDFLRTVTGIDEIAFADAQGTDFRAGDFLTTHDDAVAGKGRRVAYVFGLTREWQADWGGLLLFERGRQVSGYIPDFNVLRLFQVPLDHHVSIVSPWVEARRISVTGWLRAAPESASDHTGS